MPNFNFCRQNCASGETCMMPDDLEAVVDNVCSSIVAHEPTPVTSTNLGQQVDSYCMRLERFRESIGIELFLPEAETVFSTQSAIS